MSRGLIDQTLDKLVGNSTTLRRVITTVNYPAISARGYTYVNAPAPATNAGEAIIDMRLIVFDAAHQATVFYSGGWFINIFNAYNGTSGANHVEIHWLITNNLQ